MESTTTTPTESDIMIKTIKLAPTDMEACMQSRIEDLEQEVRVQRLEALAAAIKTTADMIKPLITGDHGYVSIVVDGDTDSDCSSVLFQGMGSTFMQAGGVGGKWYGSPLQRTVKLTLPSGQVLESIQRLSEVKDAQ
tara:strand:- start:39 stop:449 length:411 start_codon:yes stop_codon:yes gene_type:complete